MSIDMQNRRECLTNLFIKIKEGKYFSSDKIKMLNFSVQNSKGQTPLMIAVENGHDDIVDALAMVDTNFWAKDNDGKTALNYIQKPRTEREKIFTDRMYASLRILEANQIILGKARMISVSYKNKNDSLKFSIRGADCQEFNFPKNTQCTSQ